MLEGNNNSFEIVWETPEGVGPGKPSMKWAPRLEAIKERPGEWALIGEDTPTSVRTWLQRRHPGFEFAQRGVVDSRAAKLYARYVGTEDAE